jgi:hypothetical protein
MKRGCGARAWLALGMLAAAVSTYGGDDWAFQRGGRATQKGQTPAKAKQETATKYTVQSIEDGPIVVVLKTVDNFAVGGNKGALDGVSKETYRIMLRGGAQGVDMDAARAFITKVLKDGFTVKEAVIPQSGGLTRFYIFLANGQTLDTLYSDWLTAQATRRVEERKPANGNGGLQ